MNSIQPNPLTVPLPQVSPPVRSLQPSPDLLTSVPPVAPEPIPTSLPSQDQIQLGMTPPPETSNALPEAPPPEGGTVQRLQTENGPLPISRTVLETSLARGTRRLEAVPQLRETAQALALEAEPLVNQMRQFLPSLSEVQSRFQAYLANPNIPLKTYTSLEAALEAANANNSGAEALIEVITPAGERAYAMLELKSGLKAEALTPALEGLSGAAYHTDNNRRLSLLQLNQNLLSARFDATRELALVAIADQASGLDVNRASTLAADRYPAYRANLSLSLSTLLETRQALLDHKFMLETQLQQARQHNPDQSAALERQLSQLGGQLTELNTYQTLLSARMAILPQSQELIPGTEQPIGALRNTPAQALPALAQQQNLIQSRLLLATQPEEIRNLENQLSLVQTEQLRNLESTAQIQAAAFNTRMRVGSLATLYQGLDQSQQRLEQKVSQLAAIAA